MASKKTQFEVIQIEPLLTLIDRRASRRDFMKWFGSFSLAEELSAAEWMRIVPPVASMVADLGWMSDVDQRLVQDRVLDFVLLAFTDFGKPIECSSAPVKEALKAFITWIEALPDEAVARFCWDLLRYDRSLTPAPVWWLHHSGRLAGPISYDNLDLAVSLADEADAMYWRPSERWSVVDWERDSFAYVQLLDHPSYLVRAAASMALGRLFYGLQTKTSGKAVPQLSEMLMMIQERETKNPGIAGPFLHGANWSVAPGEWGSLAGDFDMKAWFVETLRRSAQEPPIPHIQSLEFYAHELFAYDAEAIRDFLKMGRNELAMMTATDEPDAIPELFPVLQEMASSANPRISAAIREYLSVRFHHAGLHHMHDVATEDSE